MSEGQVAEASTSSAPIVFKKRNKHASSASHRRIASDSPAPRASTSAAGTAADGGEASTSTNGTPQ